MCCCSTESSMLIQSLFSKPWLCSSIPHLLQLCTGSQGGGRGMGSLVKQSTNNRCLAACRAACHSCAMPVALPPLSSDNPVRDRAYRMFYGWLFLLPQDVSEKLVIEAILIAFVIKDVLLFGLVCFCFCEFFVSLSLLMGGIYGGKTTLWIIKLSARSVFLLFHPDSKFSSAM